MQVSIHQDEPMLKYSKFYSVLSSVSTSVSSSLDAEERPVLQLDSMITAIAVTDRFVAIGSNSGYLLLLDAQGNVIKEWKDSHSMTINQIEIDSTKEFLASASTDGTVVIASLYNSGEKVVHNFKRPVLALALEPDFGKKSSRQFISGGTGGSLTLTAKGWFGPSQTIIHSGRGSITNASWNTTTLIAWANEVEVNVYDTASYLQIGNVEKGNEISRGDLLKCNICWTSQNEFLVGWAKSVRVVAVKTRTAVEMASSGLAAKYLQIVHQFETEFIVSGIAPLDNTIVLLGNSAQSLDLANIDVLGGDTTTAIEDKSEKAKSTEPPEIHIVNTAGLEIANDVLSLAGYQQFSPSSYRFGHICLDEDHSKAVVEGKESGDHVFYIASPRDILVAKPRDVKDHVAWLTEAGHFKPALALVEKSAKEYTAREKEQALLEIGQKLLDKLLEDGHFDQAAEWCPKILGSNEEMWEKWVLVFTEYRQAKTLAAYVPISNPKLSFSLYELILNDFMQTDLDGFHKLILKWPSELYNVKNVIKSVEIILNHSTAGNERKQLKIYDILADLCDLDKQFDQAIYYCMLQRKPGQADRIERENLFSFLQNNVLLVMQYAFHQSQLENENNPLASLRACASSKSLQLLVTNPDFAPVSKCVSILSPYPQLLYIYLDALFTLCGDANESIHPFQDRQVELYAEYDPSRLLDFLRTASAFSFPKAYDICFGKDLVPEMLYLLGKMGDNRKALHLIIERVGDVEMAIDFAKEQNDASLWNEFVKFAMDKPAFIVGLLRNSGGHIDPLEIIEQIPKELEIPQLKAAIIQIMTDCSVQLSLRESCETILQSDIWDTFADLTRAQRIGSKLTPSSVCCLCEEAISETIDHLVVFYCSHYFHASCISANIMLVDDDPDGVESRRVKTALLDKAIDCVYNRAVQAGGPPPSMIPIASESSWVDTKSISCPICHSSS